VSVNCAKVLFVETNQTKFRLSYTYLLYINTFSLLYLLACLPFKGGGWVVLFLCINQLSIHLHLQLFENFLNHGTKNNIAIMNITINNINDKTSLDQEQSYNHTFLLSRHAKQHNN